MIAALLLVCPKCRRPARTLWVAPAGAIDFRRCGECSGLFIYTPQAERGSVWINGIGRELVDAAGELDARPATADPPWYVDLDVSCFA